MNSDAPVRSLNVLLVEDNKANVLVAEAHMDLNGHHVTVAENGRAGVEAFAGGQYDIVLMDIQMPIVDGLSAAREIRGNLVGQTVPIVAVTAGNAGVTREMALDAGMNEFVKKPVDWPHLLSLMSKLTN